MINITIVTSPGCHTCETVKDILNDLEPKYDLEIEEVDVTTDRGKELANKHNITSAPGIIIEGDFFSSGTVSEDQLRTKLDMLK